MRLPLLERERAFFLKPCQPCSGEGGRVRLVTLFGASSSHHVRLRVGAASALDTTNLTLRLLLLHHCPARLSSSFFSPLLRPRLEQPKAFCSSAHLMRQGHEDCKCHGAVKGHARQKQGMAKAGFALRSDYLSLSQRLSPSLHALPHHPHSLSQKDSPSPRKRRSAGAPPRNPTSQAPSTPSGHSTQRRAPGATATSSPARGPPGRAQS